MLSELFYPHGSGGELATYLYAELLRKAGINVVVVTNRFSGEPEVSRSENLIVYRLPLLNETRGVKYSILRRFDVLISGFMKKLMKWADVVYIPKFWYSAIPFAKIYGKPVIVHLHGYTPVCPLSTLYDASNDATCTCKNGFCSLRCIYNNERNHGESLFQTLTSVVLNSTVGYCFGEYIKLSDAVICVSKAQSDFVKRLDATLHYKIHVIYNPLPKLSYMNVEGDDFGYFGGLSYLKGFHVLRKSMVYVNRISHKQIHVHATKFPNLDKRIIESFNQLGISVYKKLSNSEYNDLYKRLRAVIVPSIWNEPLPYVITEAILRGRIVIASQIGGIPEQVEGCKGAFLFKAGDYKELANTIEYLSGFGRDTVNDFGLHDRRVLLKRYGRRKALQELIRVCESIV